MKKKLFAILIGAAIMLAAHGAPAAADDGTTATLLQSTELLLISQATLSYLAIGLVDTNMEHDYTTNEEDRNDLETIMESLSLAQETVNSLTGSKVIADADLEFIKNMGKVNENLIKATAELQKYCADENTEHFDKAAGFLETANTYLDKATKLMK